MNSIDFPIFRTKISGVTKRYNLSDPAERAEYFAAKVGEEIKKLRAYLEHGTFVAYMLGKKNSGKGTYSKLFMEAVGSNNVGHVSIGDIVRDAHLGLESPEKRDELLDFLRKNYRGFHTVEELVANIEGRGTSSLISTELIVALIKYEISKHPKQAIFLDGFPRGLDQIPHSMFLKELIGYREDPDFLVFLHLPESVIDERIKYRVICPICKTPRNTRLLATKEVGYDEQTKTFYLRCDNPSCNLAQMVSKEGDELGIEPIRQRLEIDDQIFRKLLDLQGLPKIYLRNAVPVAQASEIVDDYEITPAYEYEYDATSKNVKVLEKSWEVNDDSGVPSYSLMPAAVVVGLIKQMVQVLGL